MIKWIIIIFLIGTPFIFLSMNSFQEKEVNLGPELGKSSIMEVAEEFVKQTSFENESEQRILNELREITEEEILKEFEIPDLEESEKILNNGIKLSAEYNQISYDYSLEKLSDQLYFSKLLDFRIKYEKYMTAIDSYIGEGEILIQKNAMMQELGEIDKQITLLKHSENVEENIEQITEYDKYKEFLPSMFTP